MTKDFRESSCLGRPQCGYTTYVTATSESIHRTTCKRHITRKAPASAEPTGIVKIPHAIGQLYSVMMVSTWHIQSGTAGQACREEQVCRVACKVEF